MSKWLKVLVSGLISACLLFLLAIPVIYHEPFRIAYLVFLVLFLASAWWFWKVTRTPSVDVPGPPPGKEVTVPPAKSALIVLGVLSIIPWAFLWVTMLAPLLGLGKLPIKVHLLFVIGIPALAVWLYDRFTKSRAS